MYSSRFTSLPKGIFTVCTLRMSSLALSSGAGTTSSLSNLPGRKSAGSRMSARLVAAITTMSFMFWMPSISASSVLTMRSVTCDSPSPPLLAAAIASISSKKMIVGAADRAFLNISRNPFSLSPTHLLMSSEPRTAMKLASLSVATAFASKVFPVFQIDFRQHAAQCFNRRFLHEALQVGANETVRLRSQFVERNVFLQGHSAGVDLQDFFSSLFVGRADFYLAVEAAGPAQCRVERVRAVGGADDYNLPS